MTILTATKTWKRPTTALAQPLREPLLSDAEVANVLRAVAFLRTRYGGARGLAVALGVNGRAIERLGGSRGRRPSPEIVFRVARLAGATIDAILGGAWPPEGTCPHCGGLRSQLLGRRA